MNFFQWVASLFKKKPQDAQAAPASNSNPIQKITPPPAPLPPASDAGAANVILGVDVSHWQAGVRWAEIFKLGFRFASAKATDGEAGVEATFVTQKMGARAAGLIFGAYHFFRFAADPILQARHFWNVAGPLLQGELPPTLDVEPDKNSAKYSENNPIDDAAADAIYSCLCEMERLFGMTPILYTNYYFFQGFKNPERFLRFMPWIPAYHTTVEKVKVPKPWPRLRFWQYSESLNIAGVTNADGDAFYGTLEQLKALTKQ